MTPKHDEREEIALHRLIKLRKSRELTQTNVGERLGLSTGQISRIENGESRLTVASLLAYCEVLSVSPSVILASEALDATNQGSLARELADAKREISILKSAVSTARNILQDAA